MKEVRTKRERFFLFFGFLGMFWGFDRVGFEEFFLRWKEKKRKNIVVREKNETKRIKKGYWKETKKDFLKEKEGTRKTNQFEERSKEHI